MPPLTSASAFAVHIFTAFGAALGFAAMLAAIERRWTLMFCILAVALVIDGVDGSLARKLRVAERLPRWSGDVLDLVIDFVTYVFVPAYALAASGILPQSLAVPLGIAIVMTSAIYFADRDMKTADNYFRGFPALWNVAAFYLFVLEPAPWLAAAAVIVLMVLTFVPLKFVHPFRVDRLRNLTMAMLVVWCILAGAALFYDLRPGPWIAGGLVVVAGYFVALGLTDRWIDDRPAI
jgi:phosphatidylcholine synthase